MWTIPGKMKRTRTGKSAASPRRHEGRKESIVFIVYEVDYHERARKIGTASTMKETRSIARKALKRSNHEFPCFISDGNKCVEDIR